MNRRDAISALVTGGASLIARRVLSSQRGDRGLPELLIRSGRIVNADGTQVADVRVVGDTISEIGRGLRPGTNARVLDATGKLLMPGGVDPHTHLHPTYGIDDLAVASRAAVAGGITTIGTFADANPGEPLTQGLDTWAQRVGADAMVDVFLHAVAWPPSDDVVAGLRAIADYGQPSFKVLLSEHDDFGSQLPNFIRLCESARDAGVVMMVHCEDPAIIASATRRLVADQHTSLQYYAASRPVSAEIAATTQMASICETTNAPMYIVHISSARALDACRASRNAGARLLVETRPVYLHLTDAKLAGVDRALYISQPPLRTDADRAGLWRGIATGDIDVLGSDHAPSTRAQKLDPALSITNTLPGMSDLRFMLPMFFSEGVGKRGLSLTRFVAATSTRAAQIFGLYPRKGVIQAGSDADIVIWDPKRTVTVTASVDYSKADYSVYEGSRVTGWPVTTIRRGTIVFDDGRVAESTASGQLIPRRRWSR